MTDEQRAECEAMRLAIKKAFYAGFDAARSANVNEAWESSSTRQAIDAAALRARAAS